MARTLMLGLHNGHSAGNTAVNRQTEPVNPRGCSKRTAGVSKGVHTVHFWTLRLWCSVLRLRSPLSPCVACYRRRRSGSLEANGNGRMERNQVTGRAGATAVTAEATSLRRSSVRLYRGRSQGDPTVAPGSVNNVLTTGDNSECPVRRKLSSFPHTSQVDAPRHVTPFQPIPCPVSPSFLFGKSWRGLRLRVASRMLYSGAWR